MGRKRKITVDQSCEALAALLAALCPHLSVEDIKRQGRSKHSVFSLAASIFNNASKNNVALLHRWWMENVNNMQFEFERLKTDKALPIWTDQQETTTLRDLHAGFRNNTGTKCFMNATLQLLFRTSDFQKYILAKSPCINQCEHVFCATFHLFDVFRKGGVVDVGPLELLLPSMSTTLQTGRQEDAHEFLTFLMSSLHNRFNLNDSFVGKFEQSVSCISCGNRSTNTVETTDLQISIHDGGDIVDCLKRHFRGDKIEGYRCPSCNTVGNAIRTEKYVSSPTCIFIQFKRFSAFDSSKVQTVVPLRDFVNFSDFSSSDAELLYELKGIICHHGETVQSGHYTSSHKNTEGLLHFDDVRVHSVATWNDKETYILLYERVRTSDHGLKGFLTSTPRKPLTSVTEGRFPSTVRHDKEGANSTVHVQSRSGNENTAQSIEEIKETCVEREANMIPEQEFPICKELKDDFNRFEEIGLELGNDLMKGETEQIPSPSKVKNNVSYEDFRGGSDAGSTGSEEDSNCKSPRKNIRKISACERYDNYERTFKISQKTFISCWNDNVLNRRKFRSLLRDGFSSENHSRCIICYKHSGKEYGNALHGEGEEMNISPIKAAYLYCSFSACKKYELRIHAPPNEDVNVHVWSNKTTFNHGEDIKTAQVREGEREQLKRLLTTIPPSKYNDQKSLEIDERSYYAFNAEKMKSSSTLKKVRAEGFAIDDYDFDDHKDLVDMRREELTNCSVENRLIKKVSEPIEIHLFMLSVVETIIKNKQQGPLGIYFDATGTVIRKSPFDRQPIYLYSGVVNMNGILLPIFEMLSSSHNKAAITSLFLNFRQMCINARLKWPMFQRVVTDCSWAILNSIILAFNECALKTYLITCYNYLQGRYSKHNMKNWVIPFLCRNHFIKMTANSLSTKVGRGLFKKVILECMCVLIEVESLADFDRAFRNFCIILIYPKNHPDIVESLQSMLSATNDIDIERDTECFSFQQDEELVMQASLKKLQGTPFQVHCGDIEASVRKTLENISFKRGATRNLFHSEGFLKRFMKRYSIIIPLWTGMMLQVHDDPAEINFVRSNANVESYFNIAKNVTLKNLPVKQRKPGRVVREQKLYVQAKLKQINEGLTSGSACTSSKKRDKLQKADNKKESTAKLKKLQFSDKLLRKLQRRAKISDATPETGLSQQCRSEARFGDRCTEKWFKKGERKGPRKTYFKKTNIRKLFVEKDLQNKWKLQNFTLPERTTDKCGKESQNSDVDGELEVMENTVTSVKLNHSIEEVPLSDFNITVPLPIFYQLYNCPTVAALEESNLNVTINSDIVTFLDGNFMDNLLFLFSNDNKPFFWEDFLSLSCSTRKLTSVAVDVSIESMRELQPHDVFLSTTSQSIQVFKTSYKDGNEFSALADQARPIWIFPLNYKNCHWVLIKVDWRKLEFAYLDVGDHKETGMEMMKTFQQFMVQHNLRFPQQITPVDKLVYISPVVNGQLDENSCGIVMLSFIRQLLSDENLSIDFSVKAARRDFSDGVISYGMNERNKNDENHFSNGLKKDVTYYSAHSRDVKGRKRRKQHEEVVVCRFGRALPPISGIAFHGLVGNEEISSTVIDSILLVLLTPDLRQRFLVVKCGDAYSLLFNSNRLTKNFALNRMKLSGKIVLLPYCKNSHWSIIEVDFSKLTYTHLDPLSPSTNFEKYKDNIEKYLDGRKQFITEDITEKKLTVHEKYQNLPKQSDNKSCGLFVVQYCKYILSMDDSSRKLNVLEEREKLGYLLLERSSPMKHLCLYCGKNEYERMRRREIISTMVICDKCFRWVHVDPCLKLLGKTKRSLLSHSFQFICIRCEMYAT